ncbi:integral membrane protein [Paraphaeosphaeria minitans]|uniref:Integral membrane protein n=1 Tax=Paraphaeosphaeria minitans TaxID=565426 RepID=A0A9P6GB08_9PLEO|nr:integral membrane protein [Paraphaeosphaeria minitans]
MAASSAGPASPAFLAETRNPYLDQHVSIAFIVIDTAFMLLFYASRYYNRKAVGTQMLVCNTLCYMLCMGSAATGILMSQIGGVGHHVAAVKPHTLQTWLQLSKVLEFTYTPAVMFAKLAALFLYHQVFEVHFYRRIIIGIGVVVVLQGVVALILAFSICRPFRYFWTQAVDVHDGTCGDVMLFYKSYSIPSLVTDVAMLVLPWPILAKLNIPTEEKAGLMFTFLAASLGIVTCTLRFVTFFTTPLFQDPTWYASGGPMIYALVEPSIYMIASILPTTRHLYRRLRRKARQTISPKGSGNGCGSGAPEDRSPSPSVRGERRLGRGTPDGWAANRHSSQEELTLGSFDGTGQRDRREMPREVVRTKIEMRDRGAPKG